MHMERCNKSAIILRENMAIQLHTTLKVLKKPDYFGKDFVNEILVGYNYYGYFPTSMILQLDVPSKTALLTGCKDTSSGCLL